MENFLNEYWDTIAVIGFNVILILKMVSLLTNRVRETSNQTVRVFKALKNEVVSLNKKSDNNDRMLRVVLNYVKDEADFKQLNKIMPQDLKDDYLLIKEEVININNENKG